MVMTRLIKRRTAAILALLVTGCNYHVPNETSAAGTSDLGTTSGSPTAGTAPTAFQYLTTNLFKARCANCHNSARASGGIDLSSHEAIISARTRSGSQVIVSGSPDTSHMVKVIENGSMPPVGGPVNGELVTILKCWITKGAPADGASDCLPLSEQTPAAPGNGGSPSNPGDGPAAPTPPVIEPGKPIPFAVVYAQVLEPYCVGCHAGTDGAGGVDLSTYEAIMRSSDRTTRTFEALKRPLVSPGNPDESKLWRVVRENEMPMGGDPLPADLKKILRQWILDGAKP